MRRKAHVAVLVVVLLMTWGPSVSAANSKLRLRTTYEKGSFLEVNLGKANAKKSVIVELGTLNTKSKSWKYSRLAQGRVSVTGTAFFCSSRLLPKASRVRVRIGAVVQATITLRSSVQLSGCSYVPVDQPVNPQATTTTTVAPTTTTTVAPTTTTTVAPTTTTTVPPTTTTTVAPTTTTTVPPTTVAPTTAAPTNLALTADSDTGDSSTDGITKAVSLVVKGSAPAGASVQVYVNGAASGSGCSANGSGQFECSLGTVPEGTHALTARATKNSVESPGSSAFTIVVDRTAPTTSVSAADEWLNSNESTTVTFTTSEATTTLSMSSIALICTMTGGCTLSNFVGVGRVYTVTFTMVNNQANGGAVRVPIGAYSDIAGNAVGHQAAITIMYDSTGPMAGISRNGTTVTITFNEVPFQFSETSLEIRQYLNGSYTGSYAPGGHISDLTPVGNSGLSWTFKIPTWVASNTDIYFGSWDQYSLGVLVVYDADANPSLYTEHLLS